MTLLLKINIGTLRKSKMPIQANPKAASHGRIELMLLKTAIHVLRKPRPGTYNETSLNNKACVG